MKHWTIMQVVGAILGGLAIVLFLDLIGAVMWIMSGQSVPDGYFIGKITWHVLKFFI